MSSAASSPSSPTSASARLAPSSAARARIASNSCSGMRTKPSSGRCGAMARLPQPILRPRRTSDRRRNSHPRRGTGGERHHRLKPGRRRLGDMRTADLAPRAADLGRAVQHEPAAHPRRRAGVDLIEQRGAEEVGAVRGRHEVVVRGVEGPLIIVVGVVQADLGPGPDADIVVVVGVGLEAGQPGLVDDAGGVVHAQPVEECAAVSGDRETEAVRTVKADQRLMADGALLYPPGRPFGGGATFRAFACRIRRKISQSLRTKRRATTVTNGPFSRPVRDERSGHSRRGRPAPSGRYLPWAGQSRAIAVPKAVAESPFAATTEPRHNAPSSLRALPLRPAALRRG
jgi:hypothetical protein